jgi:iron complex outermembrane receptor protein
MKIWVWCTTALLCYVGPLAAQEKTTPPASINLEEVEIITPRQAAPATGTSATLTLKDLEQTRGGSLGEVLTNIAGVSTLQTGATIAKPVIQGLHSNRILILNNGIRQEGQQWGMEHAPEIDPFVASRITVIKGAEGVRYGPEAIGGVVLVEPAALSKIPEITGELYLTGATNGRAAAVSGRLDGGIQKLPGFAWRLQGTGRTSGNIQAADYYLENTGTRELNLSGALGYTKKGLSTELYLSHFQSGIGIFSGSHIGSIEDLQARIANGRPFETGGFSNAIDAPRQNVAHTLLKLKGQLDLKNRSQLNLLYGLQKNKREEYDIRRGGRSSIPALDLSLLSQTLDLSFEKTTERGFKNTIGVNGIVQVNNNVPGTLATPLIPNYDTYTGGAYLISKLLKDNYVLEGGIRYDHKYLDALGYDRNQELYGGAQTFDNLTLSLGAAVHLNSNWSLRTNLGSAWRPPTASELYSNGLHHGSAAFERGNKALESEKSFKWTSSAEYHSEKLSLDLSVFYNHIDQYIYLQPSGEWYESIRGVFPTFDYSQTNARLTGADLSLRYRINDILAYDLKGAWVRAKDLTNDRYLPWIPADRLENSIGYQSRPSDNTKTESYLKLSHVFVARQDRYQENSDYTAPPPGYHLLNLNAGISFPVQKYRLSFNTSINNISNTEYKDYMNRFRYYAHDQGRNLILRAMLKF